MKTLFIIVAIILTAGVIYAEDMSEIKIPEPKKEIFVDAHGWQPYKPADNIAILAGASIATVGIVNIMQGNENEDKKKAGIVQFIMGSVLLGLALALGK